MKRLSRPAAAVIDMLLAPLCLCAVPWVRQRAATILDEGAPLTADERILARKVGVAAPDRVRVMSAAFVPMPLPRWLRRAAERSGWLPPDIAGMTFGFGIVLRGDCRGDRRLLAHELAHVAQYERLGRFAGFLRHYLRECAWPGYPHGPLEIEARNAEALAAREPATPTQDSENVIPYTVVEKDGSAPRGLLYLQVNR